MIVTLMVVTGCGAATPSITRRAPSPTPTQVTATPAPSTTPTPIEQYVDPQRRFSILFASEPAETQSTSNGTAIDTFQDGPQAVVVFTLRAGYVGDAGSQARSDAASIPATITSCVHGKQDGHPFLDCVMAQMTGVFSYGHQLFLYYEERIINVGRYVFVIEQYHDQYDPPYGFAAFAQSGHILV
jgi:hypothetical protein